MPSEDFKKNLPHLIGIGILLIALLLVATKSGIVRCSDLGSSYCDVYYSVMGRPQVLILYDEADMGAMGDVRKLSRMVQDQHGVPVRILDISKLSAGMLKDYQVVVVEQVRRIPTEKLEILKDYVFNDMGRLVWVGDSGTIGGGGDQLCKTMKYTVKWTQEDGTRIEEKDFKSCVKESEIPFNSEESVSERMRHKKDAIVEKAWKELEDLCRNAFRGRISPVKRSDGYSCEVAKGGLYTNIFMDWVNEESFKEVVNPWVRGEYETLGKEEAGAGIDFGGTVLGISFIADDYAVREYEAYSESLVGIQQKLLVAHVGFVDCSNSIKSEGCNPAAKESKIYADLRAIMSTKSNAETQLNGFVSTLRSMATNKANQNETAAGMLIDNAANEIATAQSSIKEIAFETEEVPGSDTLKSIESMKLHVESAKNQLLVLRGSESDEIIVKQYDSMVAQVGALVSSVESKLSELDSHIEEHESCVAETTGSLSGELAKATGYPSESARLLGYASPLTEDAGTVNFILEATETDGSLKNSWAGMQKKLESIDTAALCMAEKETITEGFKAAAEAISLASEARAKLDPQKEAGSLATLQAADEYHALIQGVSKSIDLKKEGTAGEKYPVPFVLVQTSHKNTYTVTQIQVTPQYKGIGNWPAITVKDPKFGTHSFGRGVVVYYAFPPETDEIFVNNLVNYILY